MSTIKFLASEEERFANDKAMLKEIVDYYETLGERQVLTRKARMQKLYNLRFGVLNPEDYIDYEEETDALKNLGIDKLDPGLSFYGVIPNVVDSIIAEYGKRYNEYVISAVNPEHSNSILEEMSNQLRDELVGKAEEAFLLTEPSEEKYNAFMQSEKIQKYYREDYRTNIEQWATHQLELDQRRLKLDDVEKKLLEQVLTTNFPIVHVNYFNGNYGVENIDEDSFFYIKSPHTDDLSLSMVAGWFKESTVGSVLNNWAENMKEEDVERLASWTNAITNTDFVFNNLKYTGNKTEYHESVQNLRAFKNLELGSSRYDEMDGDLVRETHMYFLLPRKYGVLTYRLDENPAIQVTVGEKFEITYAPRYDGEKIAENLIYGEHVDWHYKNELYRAIKIDVGDKTWRHRDIAKMSERSIWIFLDKNSIQYPASQMRYGIRMPLHGGPINNKYSQTFSDVEKAGPDQVLYNWFKNRIQQLTATEVGKFLLFNQNLIPSESFDGSWGQNNLMKFLLVAKDNSVAPVDPSMANVGQQGQMSPGFGQVVDLTKTEEILQKYNIAALVKTDIYEAFGLTREIMFGFSPEQSVESISRSMEQSINQVQTSFDRVDQISTMLRETLLDTAQYLASQGDMVQINYAQTDGTRVIFSTNTEDFLLHKLGLFVKNSKADANTLERIKQTVLQTNTMGADSLEMSLMLTAKSIPELFNRLKETKAAKMAEQQQLNLAEQQQMQMQIDANEKAAKLKVEEENRRWMANAELQVYLAQIKSLGFANSTAPEIADEMAKLEKINLDRDRFNSANEARDMINALKTDQLNRKTDADERSERLKERIEMRKLELKEKEIMARNKRSEAID